MPEPTGETLGPVIKTSINQEIRPYQELKERLGPQKYDAVIVFGEGPIKRIFFSDEKDKIDKLYKPELIDRWKKSQESSPPTDLSGEELTKWLESKGPRTQYDPDFRVVDVAKHDVTDDEKKREDIRTRLENIAHYSYKRYGELNALAGGLLLYTGKTEKLILSGGRTIPEDKIQQGQGFPSEAELMRDLIIRNFGQKMFERDREKLPPDTTYEKYRDTVLMDYFVIEDSATNTIDNIVRSVNHSPDTFFNSQQTPQIGLLGNNHQVERCVTLLNLFTGNEKGAHPISSQNDVLKPYAEIRNKSGNKKFFPELLRYMTDEATNKDLQDKNSGEAIGREKLEKPEDMFWWLAYVSHSEVPQVFDSVFSKLKNPTWEPYSTAAFKILGLDFNEYANIENFKDHPDLIEKLRKSFAQIIAGDGSLRRKKVLLS